MLKQSLLLSIFFFASFISYAQTSSIDKPSQKTGKLKLAIFDFHERSINNEGVGILVAEYLALSLSHNKQVEVLERTILAELIEEQKLKSAGIISQNNVLTIGRLSSAQVIITGSVFSIKGQTHIIAKLISTKTTRAFTVSLNGKKSIKAFCETLSKKILALIDQKQAELIPVQK